VFAGALVMAGLAAGAGASVVAAGSPFGALALDSASLRQDGPELVWRVRTAGPFTPSSLAAAHRSLCLIIVATADLCVGHSGSSSHPPLYYSRVAGSTLGRAHRIAATVTRTGEDELTASFLPASVGVTQRSLRWQAISVGAPQNCMAARVACVNVLPARPALVTLSPPRPTGCVARGPSLVYGGSPTLHDIALTFDDGPWDDPPTMDFIRLLAREHVPASFFEIGDQISAYDRTGSVERAMLANGDMIGDHTWTHPDMAALPAAKQRSELELTVEAIRHATGFTPCLWRPPYGDISPELISLARSLGLLTIMWNIDPRDWSLPGVTEIIDNVTTHARNGGIVEEHFGGGPRFETLDALPTEITRLRARGYRFVTVAQLLHLRMLYSSGLSQK
jgi:peptidoglycan/xylan/chitin deacetylase (PgdA/CDA1 family)